MYVHIYGSDRERKIEACEREGYRGRERERERESTRLEPMTATTLGWFGNQI